MGNVLLDVKEFCEVQTDMVCVATDIESAWHVFGYGFANGLIFEL